MARGRLSSWSFLALASASACVHVPRVSDERTPTSGPQAISVAELPVGARIRYVAGGKGQGLRFGRVAGTATDTIWLASGRTVPVAGLHRLDISRGGEDGPSRILWSAAIGAGAGAILGALVPPDTAAHHRPSSRRDMAVLGALYGCIVGLGAAVFMVPSEQWEPVALPQERE